MRDSAAKTYYVITLQGDRGPYCRADLQEAAQAGEVQREDQVRSAFGRPLGTVAQVLSTPASDRAPVGRSKTPPARPVVDSQAQPASRPWLVPLVIALVVLVLVGLLMALRKQDETPWLPPQDTPQPAPQAAQQPTSEPLRPPDTPIPVSPAVSNGDVLPGLAEAKNYRVLYDLDLRRLGSKISYKTDNSSRTKDGFDRVAFLVELSTKHGPRTYLWAAMDAFTSDPRRLGIPTVESKAFFQTAVTNLQVRSNVPGVQTGDFPTGGNIEFWPSQYSGKRSPQQAGGSDEIYDFNDTPGLGADGKVVAGYGCMQVHNGALKQTLFAINHWSEGKKADIGIGNAPGLQTDWTFQANADSYSAARLRVLIKPR